MRRVWILMIVLFLFIVVLCYIYIVPPGKSYEYESDFLNDHSTDYVYVDDVKIHYIKMGQGDPLILIHGGGAWLYAFRNNFEELSKYYTVYALDMPGHGYTEYNPDIKLDLEYTTRIIQGFMDGNQIDRASILGNSWGGGWALYFTQKYPERVNKLILVDSSGLESAAKQDESIWKWLEYPILGELIVHCFSYDGVKDGYAVYDRSLIGESVYKEYYKPLTFHNNLIAQYKYQRDLDWTLTEALFQSMKVDTLIIWGDKDNYIPIEFSYELHEKISNTCLKIIKDAGHMPFEEKPDEFNNIIIDYLGY